MITPKSHVPGFCGGRGQARSTDRYKLTASQQFRHDLIPDFVTVISSQSEGLGKMALGIVRYDYDHFSQLIGVIWFDVSLFGGSSSQSVIVDLLGGGLSFEINVNTNQKSIHFRKKRNLYQIYSEE